MKYFITREGQEYGPYTLADLQRYTASGNVLLTDLVRSEGMTDWVPVAQVIGTIAVPVSAPVSASTEPAVIYPDPPSLHWGIALILGVITCGIFGWIWALIQASFVKTIVPSTKAVMYFAISLAFFATSVVMNFSRDTRPFASLLNLVGVIIWWVASFNMRSSLEEHYNSAEPIALTLGPVMTFFFNIYYFQYHFTKINELKKRRVLGASAGL
ncbi:MAG TPA: GYF domain-containing protein [Terriglobales bacterium]|nr:GYF domain-containing protein [Terriglobales bacterium]